MTDLQIATIDVNQLKQLLDRQVAIHLIDVREDYEWQQGAIPGAIHIPKEQLTSKIACVVSDKTAPIYLHCQAGVRSLFAAQYLLDLGYQQVYSVDGGLSDWMVQGYPVQMPAV